MLAFALLMDLLATPLKKNFGPYIVTAGAPGPMSPAAAFMEEVAYVGRPKMRLMNTPAGATNDHLKEWM